MKRNRIKQPPLEKNGRVHLQPQSDMERPDECHPVFSFEYMVSDFDVDKCEKNDRANLAVTLLKLSKLTWAQIKGAHRHGLGFEKIERKDIKTGIPQCITPEVQLIAFRFSGKKPMVGYRLKRTFYIIWLDRNFSLYDHG